MARKIRKLLECKYLPFPYCLNGLHGLGGLHGSHVDGSHVDGSHGLHVETHGRASLRVTCFIISIIFPNNQRQSIY